MFYAIMMLCTLNNHVRKDGKIDIISNLPTIVGVRLSQDIDCDVLLRSLIQRGATYLDSGYAESLPIPSVATVLHERDGEPDKAGPD